MRGPGEEFQGSDRAREFYFLHKQASLVSASLAWLESQESLRN